MTKDDLFPWQRDLYNRFIDTADSEDKNHIMIRDDRGNSGKTTFINWMCNDIKRKHKYKQIILHEYESNISVYLDNLIENNPYLETIFIDATFGDFPFKLDLPWWIIISKIRFVFFTNEFHKGIPISVSSKMEFYAIEDTNESLVNVDY